MTLESIFGFWLLIESRYSKSARCLSSWWLEMLFIQVCSIEINFEYCLLAWVDLIHRCFFDSRWSSSLNHVMVIFVLDLQPSFNSIGLNRYGILKLVLFQTLCRHSLAIDSGVNHRLTLFYHRNSDRLIYLVPILNITVFLMKTKSCWEMVNLNQDNVE